MLSRIIMQMDASPDSRSSAQNSSSQFTRMLPIPTEEFVREGTAEITNDPRFFTENVIDKRLMAFEALAIITELLAEVASKECFELSREFEFVGDQWFIG